MAEATPESPQDSPQTGMLLWLAGIKLDLHEAQAFHDAAHEMGIFSGNVVDARVTALDQQLTIIHTPTMRDQLTPAGKKYLKQTYPKEVRKLAAKTLQSFLSK